ncbi:MAG: helix-turn-helix domain-containing protein [Syntrophaceae bacterium]|nr:helix-turn-helix domain-containing protein [Syntrophaceae bacterium]
MKRIEEQTHYEILEVSPDADLKEIQRAYDHAKETFHADSPAIYSLFSEEEMRKIQAAIEEAYRVLMDEALRKSYHQSHSHLIERSSSEKQTEKSVKSSEIKSSLSFTDLSIEVGEMTYRGRSLKQIREKLGIDLKAISAKTKINIKTLELIEEEDLEHLPAMVYLKGFLKAYARALNLDAQKLIEGYFELFKEKGKK